MHFLCGNENIDNHTITLNNVEGRTQRDYIAKLEYKDINSVYKAADYYYNYLHDSSLSKLRYMRELYWFDKVILSKYKGIVVHISCFHTIYQFTNGINIPDLLYESPLSREGNHKEQIANHLTIQENIELANKIYKVLK